MSFNTPDQSLIKANILRDILNLLPQASVADDSDYAIRGSAHASAIEGLYQHQQWIVRQIFPDTADFDLMEVHAALRKITRKLATVASGSISFTGTPAATIPSGTEAKTLAGVAYVTTIAGVLNGAGNATIAAQASVAGLAGNAALNTALTLTAAPAGINATALIFSMAAGTNVETDASLLSRLLFVLRNPPSSGNKADYKRWALEVPGCDAAFVYPLRRGLGTTDVIITSAGGLPSAQLITDVTTYIDNARPCGVNTLSVFAPALLLINFTIQIKVSTLTLAVASALIGSALDSYFATLLPGDAFVKSVAEAIISDIVGISDRAISAPAANVVPLSNSSTVEWVRKGSVTVTLMP